MNKNKDRHTKLRKEAIDKYGGKCVCCKEKEMAFLTIDHKKGGGSRERKKVSTIKNIVYFLKKNNYPKSFQILCFNCNWASRNGKICPHQMVSQARRSITPTRFAKAFFRANQ